jgi:methyl-accepting chemotaxis protein
MANTNDEDRRRYERVPGNGAQATLRPPGGREMQVAIQDMSRGGIAARCDWSATAGTEVQLTLPGTDGAVGARVVWSRNGVLALAFRQDAATLRQVDQALASVSRTLPAAA